MKTICTVSLLAYGATVSLTDPSGGAKAVAEPKRASLEDLATMTELSSIASTMILDAAKKANITAKEAGVGKMPPKGQ